MSIPPPGGAAAPADDWTDDPSFDLSLASSSTSSSGSRASRPSLGGARLSGSPLRQMHVKQLRLDDDEDEVDFGLDDDDEDVFDAVPTLRASKPMFHIPLPTPADNTPKARGPRTSGASTSSTLRSLQASATVMGQGPAGVGTITRLGGASTKPSVPSTNIKARARAMEKAWEADVDFDSGAADFELKTRKMSMSPKRVFDIDALDDLPDLEEDDQATLKASATLKAKLPPPRSKDGGTLKRMPPGVTAKPDLDDDMEGDLVFPLSLTNLSLATQSQPRVVRPRASMTSTTTSTATDWDSPSTPSTSGRKGTYRWGEDGSHGRASDTSMTSMSDGPAEKHKVVDDDDLDLEDNFEDGLELPEPAFFSARNAVKLNKILDRKRKQQYAPPQTQTLRNDGNRGDDSFEDGLVLDNPRAELSHRRLEKNRRNRTIPAPFLLGAERKRSDGSSQVGTVRRPPSRGGAATPSGLRTHSGEGQYMSHTAPREPRVRRTSGPSMPPPAVPPARDTTTPSRLRQQRSHHSLGPTPAPVLGRKQSLASLQDALAAGRVRPDTEIAPNLRFGSGSRLTMPTSSSMAKIRPPVQSAFRDTRRRVMEMPRRTRQWGDGTELEGIEDLCVEDSPGRSPGNTLRGRKSMERISRALREGGDKPVREPPAEEKKKTKRRPRKQAMLIKNLGAVDKRKVVGEMTWNPKTLRWEGNEGVLRDFDAVASSARPALITHFTGSSAAAPSPVAQAPAVRIVGDMKFDPEKMCWVSLLPPEEEEPDPFEGLADDEDSLVDIPGTVTRSGGRKLISIGISNVPSSVPGSAMSTRFVSESTSIAQSTASWEDRARPLPIPDELFAECKDAEERHRREMRGWTMRPIASASDARDRERREEKRLWEVRNLAMRS